ncbi:hypothetical protein [Streptacidiphilus sp. PAMC 29251]
MPALNITFTDEEMTTIRCAAAKEDASMKNYARDAVLAKARRQRIAEATARAVRNNLGLSKRLADK